MDAMGEPWRRLPEDAWDVVLDRMALEDLRELVDAAAAVPALAQAAGAKLRSRTNATAHIRVPDRAQLRDAIWETRYLRVACFDVIVDYDEPPPPGTLPAESRAYDYLLNGMWCPHMYAYSGVRSNPAEHEYPRAFMYPQPVAEFRDRVFARTADGRWTGRPFSQFHAELAVALNRAITAAYAGLTDLNDKETNLLAEARRDPRRDERLRRSLEFVFPAVVYCVGALQTEPPLPAAYKLDALVKEARGPREYE
jgi:hypothetical protein